MNIDWCANNKAKVVQNCNQRKKTVYYKGWWSKGCCFLILNAAEFDDIMTAALNDEYIFLALRKDPRADTIKEIKHLSENLKRRTYYSRWCTLNICLDKEWCYVKGPWVSNRQDITTCTHYWSFIHCLKMTSWSHQPEWSHLVLVVLHIEWGSIYWFTL